jgi:hypothetical protein
MLTEKEAEEAVQAAVKAYNNGRGEWPLMPVWFFCFGLLIFPSKK